VAGTVSTTDAGLGAAFTLPLLSGPAGANVAVTVTTSDAGVADAARPVIVPAGASSVALTVHGNGPGTAVLTLTAGDVVRHLTIVVGTPPAGAIPIIIAPPVGVCAPGQLTGGTDECDQ
jgi:hypothetical protein